MNFNDLSSPSDAPEAPRSPSSTKWIESWIYILSQLILTALIVGIAFSNLLHPSHWQRTIGFWHSLFATIATLIFLYTGSFAVPVLQGTASIARVQRATLASAIAASLGLFSGVRALARYKAPVDDAAGVFLQVFTPIMQAGMTWHFLISFSLFGLAVSSFYCFLLYGDRLLDSQPPYLQIRATLSLCLTWLALIGLSTFVVGIGVAKIHSL